MNLNCNYINNVYMEPMLSSYVEVRNRVRSCVLYFTLNYFYEGEWRNKTSQIFSFGESKRLYYEKSSSNRDFTIFKRTSTKDIFIFSTLISSQTKTCYEVTGTSAHTLINVVPC